MITLFISILVIILLLLCIYFIYQSVQKYRERFHHHSIMPLQSQTSGNIRPVQQKRRDDIRAVYELSRQIVENAERVLKALQHIKSECLILFTQEANASFDSYKQTQIVLLKNRIDEVVNGDYFFKAAKAVLPYQKFKTEFNEYVNHPNQSVLDKSKLRNGYKEIAATFLKNSKESADAIIKEQNRLITLSSEARAGLTDLQSNPKRFDEVTGQNEELKKLMSSTRQDIVTGLTLTIFGAALLEAPEEEVALDIIQAVAVDGLAGGIAEQLTEMIYDWIVAEVGEQFFMEFAEAGAAAITGLGILFTAWKAVKYGRLAKRLFIDKEPLEKMKTRIKENELESLNQVDNQAKRLFEQQMQKFHCYLEELESRFIAIRDAAVEREKWAFQQL